MRLPRSQGARRATGCMPNCCWRKAERSVICGATVLDASAYEACAGLLQHEVTHRHIHLPDMSLADGNNTKQAIAYQYRNWRDFFNDRQLLALGWLQEAISALPELATRDVFFNAIFRRT